MYDPVRYIGIIIVAAAVLWIVGRSLYISRVRRNMPQISDAEFASEFAEEIRPTALRVRDVLRKSLGDMTEQVQPDTDLLTPAVLGNDADLRFTSYIMDLEQELKITIPDQKAGELRTLRQIVDYMVAMQSVDSKES